ncbi:MAG: type II secretion system protein [Patescibacteria group bacterium]
MKNVKGFTLPEILLVVFLLAILGTIAASSYLNSTSTFNYLSQYKKTISAIRTARSFAITNKSTNDEVPKYYGVYIDAKKVVAFADIGDKILEYDAKTAEGDTKFDVALWEKEFDCSDTDQNFNCADQDFNLRVLDMKADAIGMPIALFYESGSGNLTMRKDVLVSNDEILKEDKCISLEVTGNENKIKKYIVIFQISGLAEEYDDLTVCDTNA